VYSERRPNGGPLAWYAELPADDGYYLMMDCDRSAPLTAYIFFPEGVDVGTGRSSVRFSRDEGPWEEVDAEADGSMVAIENGFSLNRLLSGAPDSDLLEIELLTNGVTHRLSLDLAGSEEAIARLHQQCGTS
jgi:hypothetical protein